MKEKDIIKCLKKTNKDYKRIKKVVVKQENNHKNFLSFLFSRYNMEKQVFDFAKEFVIKNSFHKCKSY